MSFVFGDSPFFFLRAVKWEKQQPLITCLASHQPLMIPPFVVLSDVQNLQVSSRVYKVQITRYPDCRHLSIAASLKNEF